MLSYEEASAVTLQNIRPLKPVEVGILDAAGRISAEDLKAMVDSPGLNVSLKDGFAVRSTDITGASSDNPVNLRLIGHAAAGTNWRGKILPGTAVRILSGAPIPKGATAVIAEEFCEKKDSEVAVKAEAQEGRNILRAGSDLSRNEVIVRSGATLQPALIGLLAAAGYARISVYRLPKVTILGTGDELVVPGKPLREGKLYASNLVTLAAWCRRYDMPVRTRVIPDNKRKIRDGILAEITDCDVMLTSGGAWKGDRDLVAGILHELGWNKLYHRIKIGPGKAVGLGLLQGKPIFCLPGGPPSNFTAFITLALPGLLRLAGHRQCGLPRLRARLGLPVKGQTDWTQFVQGIFRNTEKGLIFEPIKLPSRLQMLSQAQGVLSIPEGVYYLPAGRQVEVLVLSWPDDALI
jgi:molybdopterin molybdotransferase